MTKKELERGVELQRWLDKLYEAKEGLEQTRELCFKDLEMIEYDYSLNLTKKNAGGRFTRISAKAAHVAVCTDLKDIDAEIERVRKEFSAL